MRVDTPIILKEPENCVFSDLWIGQSIPISRKSVTQRMNVVSKNIEQDVDYLRINQYITRNCPSET